MLKELHNKKTNFALGYPMFRKGRACKSMGFYFQGGCPTKQTFGFFSDTRVQCRYVSSEGDSESDSHV
jgi:hypothetical protein